VAAVAITGASGLLGGNLAAELIAAGHHVIATRRAGTKVGHLADLAIEWREADLGSAAALARAFEGAEVVFHCAAAVSVVREVTHELRESNVGGTQRVVEACMKAGVQRLVHTSSVVAIGASVDGTPCDETATWNLEREGLLDGYSVTKREAEIVVQDAAGALDAVIVNPAYMFGPRDARPSSGKLLLKVAQQRLPGWTSGYNNFVDVRDVARGMIAAWQRGTRGERYILGGHNLSYREVFELTAKVAGVRAPMLRLPRVAANVVGAWGDFVAKRGKEALVNSTQIRYAYTDKMKFSSAKAQRELGYTISPIEPAIRDALAWMRAHQM
jgi:dihydroflavonol-4-reductase